MALQEITGKIEDKTIKEGMSGSGRAWTKYTFLVNGKNYATFDQVKGQEFKVGDNVKMRGEQEGKYWTLKEMEHIDEIFTASESVNTLKTPQVERVVTPAVRTTRTFAEVSMDKAMDTARHIYLGDANVDGLKFNEVVDMVLEEFVRGVKQLEKELGL